MSEEIINKVVPKLRFPEFGNTKQWDVQPLRSLAVEITEKAGTNSYKLMSITSGVGLISQIEKFGREIAGDSYKNYYVINKGDFAYNKSSTKLFPEGEIAMLEKETQGAVPNSIFTCFRFNPNYVLSHFAKYPFANNVHGKWLRSFIAVGARANGALQVNIRDLFTLPILFPSLQEQQKIADCLSSLDDLITAQKQKLEALKSHKKGLMQQLFPAEGETVPKLRFAEFRESGDWEEIPLGKVAEIITGNTPDTSDSSYYGGSRLFVSPGDISEGRYITQTKTVLSNAGYSQTRHIRENSILFVCIGSTIGKVAQNKYECSTNQQINSLVPHNVYSSDFIYSLLEYKAKDIANIAGNQAVPIVNKTLFSSVLLRFPLLEEQQKIGYCFSTLDELIDTQTEKIEALKAHKKGLMQQLFPNIKE